MSVSSGLSRRALMAAGQPISFLMQQALAHPELISLAAGFVDQHTLPVEPTAEALRAILADPARGRAALQYGTTPGYLPLREAILDRLLDDDDLDAKPAVEQVVITAGSNELLHVLTDSLFDPGDIVLCGAPSYFVFLGMIANLGVQSVGVEVDSDGIIPEAVDEQLAHLDKSGQLPRVKAIYVVTYYDNPCGITLAENRRAPLIEIANRWSKHHNIYVIEDAAYRQLRYYGEDRPSVRAFDPTGDTVVLTDTFSKSFSPGIRVGWGVLPPALVQPVLDQKGNIDFGSPNFSQHLMATVLELGLFDEHVARLRESYCTKLDVMLEAADEFLAPLPGVEWIRPEGGLYVWLQMPEEIDTGPQGTLLEAALEEGVLYVPGQYCYASEGIAPRRNMIRLSFGVQSPARIREGIEALARAASRVLEHAPTARS